MEAAGSTQLLILPISEHCKAVPESFATGSWGPASPHDEDTSHKWAALIFVFFKFKSVTS